jgi:hypothetical protein
MLLEIHNESRHRGRLRPTGFDGCTPRRCGPRPGDFQHLLDGLRARTAHGDEPRGVSRRLPGRSSHDGERGGANVIAAIGEPVVVDTAKDPRLGLILNWNVTPSTGFHGGGRAGRK